MGQTKWGMGGAVALCAAVVAGCGPEAPQPAYVTGATSSGSAVVIVQQPLVQAVGPVQPVRVVQVRRYVPAPRIVNPGFEDHPLAEGTWQVLQELPGWTTSFGPGIELQNHAAGSPGGGQQHVELDSHAPSGMYQNVATTPGATYVLRFLYSPRPGTPPDDSRIEVRFDDQVVQSVSGDGTGQQDTTWRPIEVVVHASHETARLEFRDTGTPNSVGAYLDDVSLTPVMQ